MKRSKKLIELLNQSLSGPISDEDKKIIDEWHTLNQIEDGDPSLSQEEDLNTVENEILDKIRQKVRQPSFLKFYNRSYFKIAATVLIVCSLSLLFYLVSTNASDSFVTVTSPKGKITRIKLPDGSSVWVNSGSTIRYPKVFNKTRNVYLIEGETFFDVAHNANVPFVVHYRDLHVKVLGTAFNIKSNKGSNNMRVTVVRGKVEVGSQTETFDVLTKDKEIILDNNGKERKTRKIDSEKVSSWKSKEINLYDVSFAEMILSIENTYDVKISYPSEDLKENITNLHFSSNDSLEEVLEMVKMIHGLNYSINGKEVTLKL